MVKCDFLYFSILGMLSSDASWPLVSEYHQDYKVLRQIASGAFGSVHCVQRRDTKVILAAKYVKSAEEIFKREVEALVSLRKSNLILQFVEFYASEPPKLCQSVLVTEFLAGGDLIERTSASVSLILTYLQNRIKEEGLVVHFFFHPNKKRKMLKAQLFILFCFVSKLFQFWYSPKM